MSKIELNSLLSSMADECERLEEAEYGTENYTVLMNNIRQLEKQIVSMIKVGGRGIKKVSDAELRRALGQILREEDDARIEPLTLATLKARGYVGTNGQRPTSLGIEFAKGPVQSAQTEGGDNEDLTADQKLMECLNHVEGWGHPGWASTRTIGIAKKLGFIEKTSEGYRLTEDGQQFMSQPQPLSELLD